MKKLLLCLILAIVANGAKSQIMLGHGKEYIKSKSVNDKYIKEEISDNGADCLEFYGKDYDSFTLYYFKQSICIAQIFVTGTDHLISTIQVLNKQYIHSGENKWVDDKSTITITVRVDKEKNMFETRTEYIKQ